MHTLLHHARRSRSALPATARRREGPLLLRDDRAGGGRLRPTGIRTAASQGRRPLGCSTATSGSSRGPRGAAFAIVIARRSRTAPPAGTQHGFLVDTDASASSSCATSRRWPARQPLQIRLEGVRVPDSAILGGRGQGHRLGQARLGPARLAHCMRWIGNAEIAHELPSGRALSRSSTSGGPRRQAADPGDDGRVGDGALRRQADCAHAAYLIEKGLPSGRRSRSASTTSRTSSGAPPRAVQVARRARLFHRRAAERMRRTQRFGAPRRRRRRGAPQSDRRTSSSLSARPAPRAAPTGPRSALQRPWHGGRSPCRPCNGVSAGAGAERDHDGGPRRHLLRATLSRHDRTRSRHVLTQLPVCSRNSRASRTSNRGTSMAPP